MADSGSLDEMNEGMTGLAHGGQLVCSYRRSHLWEPSEEHQVSKVSFQTGERSGGFHTWEYFTVTYPS